MDADEVPDGEVGELVITTLVKQGAPLAHKKIVFYEYRAIGLVRKHSYAFYKRILRRIFKHHVLGSEYRIAFWGNELGYNTVLGISQGRFLVRWVIVL